MERRLLIRRKQFFFFLLISQKIPIYWAHTQIDRSATSEVYVTPLRRGPLNRDELIPAGHGRCFRTRVPETPSLGERPPHQGSRGSGQKGRRTLHLEKKTLQTWWAPGKEEGENFRRPLTLSAGAARAPAPQPRLLVSSSFLTGSLSSTHIHISTTLWSVQKEFCETQTV